MTKQGRYAAARDGVRVVMVAIIGHILVADIMFAQTPDFSGTWTLNRAESKSMKEFGARSRLDPLPAPASWVEIAQDRQTLRVTNGFQTKIYALVAGQGR